MQETHYLDIRIAIDFSEVLSRKNIQGVKLVLNEKDDENLIPSYARHLRDILENVLKDRGELYIKDAALTDKNDIENDPGESEVIIDEVHREDSEERNNDVTRLLSSQLDELSDMEDVIVSKIEVKEGVFFDKSLIPAGAVLEENIQNFEEEILHQAYIPYRLTITDLKNENNETILLGGF